MFLCVRGSNVVFKQGKKTDGAVNAHAVNVTMKRKYRYVNDKEDKGFYLHGAVCWSCCTQPHAADQLLFCYMVFLVIVWTPVVQVTELIHQTSSVPSQWALSASTTVIIANHLCRCFYAEIPALPLVLDDVICKCCEGNSDVMCFYIYFFFVGSTWTEKGDSTDHWTSLLESMNKSLWYLTSLPSFSPYSSRWYCAVYCYFKPVLCFATILYIPF